jgi:N-acetylmuramoyl-L-alanine amidase
MARRIAISSGHGKYVRGASDIVDEVDEVRKIVDRVAELLGCPKFHDNTSHDQSTNLTKIVNWHNSQSRDLDVSIHLNAYQHTSKPMGVEVLYVTQEALAGNVSDAISEAGGFLDRGAKYRSDLKFLNSTHEPAILIETFFCDSQTDVSLYHAQFDAICEAIAESISGVTIPTEPPIEPPLEISGNNRVEITASAAGDVSVVVNGALMHGHQGCEHLIEFTLAMTGDVVVVINGEEFHNY